LPRLAHNFVPGKKILERLHEGGQHGDLLTQILTPGGMERCSSTHSK
jgi:hypothetical protein